MITTAHIASIPSRQESLRQCVRSIYNQVDKVYVMLNGYSEVPSFLRELPKVQAEVLDNSLGDAARYSHFGEDDGYSFFCDDDLIYSRNYCQYLIYKYNQHKGCLVTLHGKVYHRPIISAHRGIKENYRCLGTVQGDHIVDTGGTGVMLIKTGDLKISLDDFKKPNMADIWIAKLSHEQNVKIVVVEHKAGIVKYMPQTETIWRSFTKDDDVYQTKVLKHFLE